MATAPTPNESREVHSWEAHICDHITPYLEPFQDPVQCLDFLSHTGTICLELFNRLPQNSRAIAIDESRENLSRFHEKLAKHPANIFLRKQTLQNHPFGESVFDLVWGVWAYRHPSQLSRILRTLYSTIKPGGTLVCALPLHGSFSALYQFIQEAQDPQQDTSVFATREEFPSIAACQKFIEEAGLIWQSSTQASFELTTDISDLHSSFLMQELFEVWGYGSSNISNMFEKALIQNETTSLDISVELGVFCATKA